MTVREAIDWADTLAPNQYTDAQKLRWLSDLDGKLLLELFLARDGRYAALNAFAGYDGDGEELLVPPPYAGDLYGSYLLSRIAEANCEIQKYNLYAALYNAAYQQFAGWFIRSFRPRRGEGWCLTCRDCRS